MDENLAFLLAAAAKKEAGENALPAVSGSDNGKVLMVEDGAWVASSTDLVVTFTKHNNTWSADKNSADIYDALSAGKKVYGVVAGSSVTSDTIVSGFTLILPLVGRNSSSAYVFGGSYQSLENTIFVSASVYGYTVSVYSKTVIVTGPASVVYTITGLPVDGVYPLSTNDTLDDILQKILDGKILTATLVTPEATLNLQLSTYSVGFVTFSTIANFNGVICSFIVAHYLDGNDDEVCEGTVAPLNTSIMTYDSGTNTLAITQA